MGTINRLPLRLTNDDFEFSNILGWDCLWSDWTWHVLLYNNQISSKVSYNYTTYLIDSGRSLSLTISFKQSIKVVSCWFCSNLLTNIGPWLHPFLGLCDVLSCSLSIFQQLWLRSESGPHDFITTFVDLRAFVLCCLFMLFHPLYMVLDEYWAV